MTARDPDARPSPGEVAVALQDAYVETLVRSRRLERSALADDEAERLAAVRRYGVLDSEPDEAIDRVARLARRLLQAEVATISIVDAEREWVKAADGAAVPQVDRATGFAADPVSTAAVQVVADLDVDPRGTAHPLLAARPELRSSAAAPLITFDGHAIGALTVFGEAGRLFEPDELQDLADLAAIAMRELELRAVGRGALFDG